MKKILIATHNPWKAQLFKPVFQDHGFDSISLADIDQKKAHPEENGATVIANALIKARYYHSSDFPWIFADDTSLEIDALDREPGVQTRRWGGRFSNDVDDRFWLDYLLERMRSVPVRMRSAYFVDGWVLITPDQTEYTREWRVKFEIAEAPVRPISPGSPIMAVALGLPTDPVQIQAAVNAKWHEWGIFEKLPNHY